MEAFADSQLQSTPERPHASRAESGRDGFDCIRHFFEKSTSSFAPTVTPPFGMATFRIRQNTTNVDITGEGESREGTETSGTVIEGNDVTDQTRNITLDIPEPGRPNLSSFSAFLVRSKSHVPVTQAPTTSDAALGTPLFYPTPPSRLVTTSDLDALERRFQVLVSAATGSVGTQFPNLPSTSNTKPIASVSFGTHRPAAPKNLDSVSSVHPAGRRIASRGKTKRRGQTTPAARDSNSGDVTSPVNLVLPSDRDHVCN